MTASFFTDEDLSPAAATIEPAPTPAAKPSRSAFNRQLAQVQAAGEDHEWYPTTDEIIAAFTKDMRGLIPSWRYGGYNRGSRRDSMLNLLDIGAGNGKVLEAIRKRKLEEGEYDMVKYFAIEKSSTLVGMLPADVFILGVDFWNTSLIDKEIAVIFSNPPYSQFREWTSKILKEAPADTSIYLVIPERWEKAKEIELLLTARKATRKILGSFDFEAAEDRRARAKVHLLKIVIPDIDFREEGREDPFTTFFNETFTYPEPEAEDTASFEQTLKQTQIGKRMNFIEALCHCYQQRLESLQRNYVSICTLPFDILKEFEISKAGLLESLKMKLATAKKLYWQRLFDGMKEINSRLTAKSRKSITDLMQAQTGIDFNSENAYAIVLWVVKNANQYFDTQLIETYEQLIEFANIEGYKSNQLIFSRDRFRYDWVKDEKNSHYRLKVGHRMVLQHCGGLSFTGWKKGIDERACNFIGDLLTVANNLGFTPMDPGPEHGEFQDSGARVYRFHGPNGPETLIRIRAFQNNNLHMQFHPDFINALNIQHGRLKGWLRNDSEAADQLDIPLATAAKYFTHGFRLTGDSLRLMAPAA